MIISKEDQVKAGEHVQEDPNLPSYPPPPYNFSPNQDPPPSAGSFNPSTPSQWDILPKAINFVAISKLNEGVRGTYVIDPTIYVPEALLPPLEWFETTRKNLSLQTMNGGVQAEIWIVGNIETYADMKKDNPVVVKLSSLNGGIKTKIHRSSKNHRLELAVNTQNGGLTIALPRSYHGPVKIASLYGSFKFSEEFKKNLTSFSDIGGTLKGFVGDTTTYVASKGRGWSGDEATLETSHGNVTVGYDDEVGSTPAKGLSARVAKFFE